jgi:hypothetical protein
MARPLIAVTDSVFPSLDPAIAALKRVDPELRMAKSTAPGDILAVAREADAILVTYAKLPGDLLRQLKRCKAIGRFGLGVDNIDIPTAAELGIVVTYVPDYCMQEVSGRPLGDAGGGPDPPPRGSGARPRRLRQHPAPAGAEGQGVRPHRSHPRSLCGARRVGGGRRRGRELR